MADYTDYVSFDPPQWVVDNLDDLSQAILLEKDRELIEDSLLEIYQTPEGRQMLEDVALKGDDGKSILCAIKVAGHYH